MTPMTCDRHFNLLFGIADRLAGTTADLANMAEGPIRNHLTRMQVALMSRYKVVLSELFKCADCSSQYRARHAAYATMCPACGKPGDIVELSGSTDGAVTMRCANTDCNGGRSGSPVQWYG